MERLDAAVHRTVHLLRQLIQLDVIESDPRDDRRDGGVSRGRVGQASLGDRSLVVHVRVAARPGLGVIVAPDDRAVAVYDDADGVDDGDHEHLDVADLAEGCALPGELGARVVDLARRGRSARAYAPDPDGRFGVLERSAPQTVRRGGSALSRTARS